MSSQPLRSARHDGEAVFAGGGQMGARMRAFDWAATPLGPVEQWPQSLKTVVRILLSSRYAMWMAWGPELTFFCNDTYAPTLGVKQPWALGRPAREVWAEIWPDIGPRIATVLQEGEATWDEALLLFLERSGYPEETYHTFSYSPLADDAGAISGMLCVVTEETERVIGERRLALLRELAAAFASTNIEEGVFAAVERCLNGASRDLPFALIYLLDAGGTTARLAGRIRLPAGHPAAPPTFDVTAKDAPWPLPATGTSAGSTLVAALPTRFPGLPGAARDTPPQQAVVVPLAQPGLERPAGFLVAALSPFRAFDAAYEGFLQLLAGQIATGLGNARAYEAERQRAEALAELDRAKTTFFSNVSHEFRTPLTLMLGPIEDELAEVTDPRHRERLEVAHRSSLRLLKLVNTLLDFSRIEAGRMQAVYEPTDLAALTADLASTFRSAVERAGMRLTVACPPLPEPVYVDRDMWEKIVLNLLSNAFKFTLEGEIAVRLHATRGAVELAVQDTGAGIPEAELPHLFERFHRIPGTRARTHEGTGIGLALVQELVKLHGGSLRVASVPDRGSTFSITLPLGHAHLPADRIGAGRTLVSTAMGAGAFVEEALRWLPDAPETRPDPLALPALDPARELPAPGTENGRPPRIVLADDNADMRDYVRRLLAEQYEVEAVADGEAALTAIRRAPPDMVLSDVMMPRRDGFDLLRAVRADPALGTIPVLLLSARAGEEARLQGLEAGADDYLVKPFSARELLARVRAHLEMSRLRRDAAGTISTINQIGQALLSVLDQEKLIQTLTDAATELVSAQFGAFFYNVVNEKGEAYALYTLSGVSREAFANFPMPRNTDVFAPTFEGRGIVRSEDITQDPRYGRNAPYYGMPEGHLPVHSYLAAPVISRTGEVLGGLFFGHGTPGVFTARHEQLLQGVAAQAAIALDNAQLFRQAEQARVEAETASRLKDEFLATVSHELRTPLNAILGHAQLLRVGNRSPEQVARGLETIERNVKVQAQLINDLLDVSRIISGKLRLDVQPVDLAAVIHAAIDAVIPAAEAKGIRIQRILDPLAARVSGDPNRLQQVVWNLLANAIKFTPNGGRVQVLLERVNSHLEITVSDTGQGIAPDFLPHVFDRFRQLDSSTTRRYGGLGLGLAIVRHLVELHGGTVRAKSPGEGQGATFIVLLPLPIIQDRWDSAERVHPLGEPPHRAPDAEGPLECPPSLQGMRVLVVDDEPDARELMKQILEECDVVVQTVPSVREALATLPTFLPEVVLSDIGMPEEDGYDLIQRIRMLSPEQGGDVPAAALTAYARSDDRRRALLAGFQAHLPKPIERDDLITIVASLGGRTGRRS